MKAKQVNILGVRIDALTIDEAIERIINRTRIPGCCFVNKPYVEFFQTRYTQLLNESWLNLPEGVALQWAAHYQTGNGSWWQLIKSLAAIALQPDAIRSVIPQRFAGTTFTWPLLRAAAAAGRSVYLVGSPYASTIDHTAEVIREQIPAINISGTTPGRDESGRFSQQLEERLVQNIRETRPDIVLIGLGFPRQEEVMQRLAQKLDHGVLIGEGGTFDYQSFGGKRRKAPRWMQAIGLEWLWRLLLEPKRVRRQIAIPRFIRRVHMDLHRRQKAVS